MTDRADKIDLALTFDKSEFEKIKGGHKPNDMDDRWFIYSDNNWIYFHRSWTGDCIFKIMIEKIDDNRYSTKECWVERDEKKYTIKDDNENRELIRQLIKDKLLH